MLHIIMQMMLIDFTHSFSDRYSSFHVSMPVVCCKLDIRA